MKPAAFERVRAALSALKPEVKKPWVILDRLPYIHATDDPNARPYSTPVVGRFDYMESADYIMACNPAAMSDILAYVDAIKAERDAMLELLVFAASIIKSEYPESQWDEYRIPEIDAAIAKRKDKL